MQNFNALGRLKRENNLAARKLSSAAYSELEEMVNYVRAKGVGMYEAEVFRKDMIGMMLEAVARGELPGETIGTERQEFCDSVAKNSPKRRGEPVLYVGFMFSFCLLLLVAIRAFFSLSASWEEPFSVSASDFVFLGYFGFFITVWGAYIRPRFPSFRKGNIVAAALLIVAVMVVYIAFLSRTRGGGTLFTVGKPAALAAAAVLFVVMFLLWNRHINGIARKTAAAPRAADGQSGPPSIQ